MVAARQQRRRLGPTTARRAAIEPSWTGEGRGAAGANGARWEEDGMNLDRFQDLVAAWQDDAALLRRRGAKAPADTLLSCATDLAEQIREWQLEALTLEQSVVESGYSYSTIQKLVSAGVVENVGKKGKPRIRRCDLPMKPGSRRPHPASDAPDLAALRAARSAG